jgi:hypothetical protein
MEEIKKEELKVDFKKDEKSEEVKKIKRESKKESDMAVEKKSNFYKATFSLTPTGKKKFPPEVLGHYWKRTTIDVSKKEFYGEVEAKIDGLSEVSKEHFEKLLEKFGQKK